MKFPQGFEVQLLKPSNGAAYPDIAHGVERYVVGVPDQPFEVRVTVPTSQFISQYIRVTLSVDGRCVGVSNIVSLYAPSATFSGFISTIHGQNLTRQFLFGKAAAATGTGTGTGSAPDINKTGGIEVKLTAVSEAPGYVMPVTAQAQPGAAAFKAVEGKKWFMQPSLSAQQGQVTGPAVTFSTRKYNDVRFLATCSMRMETAAILILRKVLNPDFPAHQAIIDQSEASMPHQEANSPPAASPAPVNAAVLNRTGIKRERGAKDTSGSKAVKTEPGSSNGRSNRQVECVDLSNMVAPVTSRARRGQKSECIDLT